MPAADTAETSEEKLLEDELSYPILLSEQLRKSVSESVHFNSECSEIDKQVQLISQLLRSTVRLATSLNQLYDRPIRHVAVSVTRNLLRATTLVRKCRRRSFVCELLTRVTVSEFRKVNGILDASAADLRWLTTVMSCGNGSTELGGGLPPIASNDPVLAWIWSVTATVQMSAAVNDRVEAANSLTALANNSDRNKNLIVDEGGIPPLLKLLTEKNSLEAEIAAVNALYELCNVEERVNSVIDCLGIGLIVKVLNNSSMNVQIKVSNLLIRMLELSSYAKEAFVEENVIRPLVSFLSFETFDDDNDNDDDIFESRRRKRLSVTIPSLVRINKERTFLSYPSLSIPNYDEGSSRGRAQKRKEREMESSEVKLELKINSAKALYHLAKDSVSNSRRITETKGLLCLAKLLLNAENEELRVFCLMTIKEITSAAELNPDLRRSAFKTNSPAANTMVSELLTLVKINNPVLQIPAIISVGSLNRIFIAKDDEYVIGPLVDQLSSGDHNVRIEASIALGKFVEEGNWLRREHAESVIEFNGVIPCMRLIREGEIGNVHGLRLLCYLAILVSDSEVVERARVLTALEGAHRTVALGDSRLRELIESALHNLYLYRGDIVI